MGISFKTLHRFVAGGHAAQRAMDRLQQPGVNIDRAILDRLPIKVAATYRHGDRWDARITLTRLRRCGSIVEAVRRELAAAQLRKRADLNR